MAIYEFSCPTENCGEKDELLLTFDMKSRMEKEPDLLPKCKKCGSVMKPCLSIYTFNFRSGINRK